MSFLNAIYVFPECNLSSLVGLENVWKGCLGAKKLTHPTSAWWSLCGALECLPAQMQSLPKPFLKASSSAGFLSLARSQTPQFG